jgi:hypothetical protein
MNTQPLRASPCLLIGAVVGALFIAIAFSALCMGIAVSSVAAPIQQPQQAVDRSNKGDREMQSLAVPAMADQLMTISATDRSLTDGCEGVVSSLERPEYAHIPRSCET